MTFKERKATSLLAQLRKAVREVINKCPFQKQGHVTYVSDKSVSHVSTSCSAERTAEREIFTFAFVSDSKGSQLRFSSCSAKESCERNLHCVSSEKKATLYTYLTRRSATFPLLAQLKRKAVREILTLCP